jgi:hypothetical protein
MLTLSEAFGEEFRGENSGIPHLAKNSEIWGTPLRGRTKFPISSCHNQAIVLGKIAKDFR